eukprot:7160570-Pyramimonas_sp.AAC.1
MSAEPRLMPPWDGNASQPTRHPLVERVALFLVSLEIRRASRNARARCSRHRAPDKGRICNL